MSAPDRLVVATGNRGKLAELQTLLAPLGMTLVTQAELDVTPAEETGLTFVENALLKARAASAQTGLPALADDSGLEVAALNGAPGIYSARYAGANASDADNNHRLLAALDGVDDRRASFRCVAVLLRHENDPAPIICEGVWRGRVLEAPRGHHGFGYDPLFLPDDSERASAELDAATKNRISHRGQALAALVQRLRSEWR